MTAIKHITQYMKFFNERKIKQHTNTHYLEKKQLYNTAMSARYF